MARVLAALAAAGVVLVLPVFPQGKAAPARRVMLAGAPAASPASARTVPPVTWCGTDESPADRPDALLQPAQVRVVYAHPTDVPDQFGAYASRIATDVAAIEAWWQGQDPTRAPRFDLAAFPGCAPGFGNLDIGAGHLPHESGYYANASEIDLLGADLGLASSPKKTLVLFDGPGPETGVCGESYSSPGAVGATGISAIFLRSVCPNDLGSEGFTARVSAHELIHDLGALFQASAPHACPGDSGHVCDTPSDIIYPTATPSDTLDAAVLDAGRDDYYGHSAAWWDVQDSPWLEHLPQVTLALSTVSADKRSRGTLAVGAPGVSSCEASCSYTIDPDAHVQVRAVPALGSRFLSWSGGTCSPAADPVCTLDLAGAGVALTATFGPARARLTVAVAGKGSVRSVPAGIRCPRICSALFDGGGLVSLSAKPATGYRFAGWRGRCSGRRCSFTLSLDSSVRAVFVRR